MSAFIHLGLVINSALVRTLSPRLAAGFVLDNNGYALLRLKSPRELISPPYGFADFHVTVVVCNIAVDQLSSS